MWLQSEARRHYLDVAKWTYSLSGVCLICPPKAARLSTRSSRQRHCCMRPRSPCTGDQVWGAASLAAASSRYLSPAWTFQIDSQLASAAGTSRWTSSLCWRTAGSCSFRARVCKPFIELRRGMIRWKGSLYRDKLRGRDFRRSVSKIWGVGITLQQYSIIIGSDAPILWCYWLSSYAMTSPGYILKTAPKALIS